jgi:glycosyltransferase involved in cell wall biosynthesis
VTGQLISFLDDDDYIKPECIETLVALLNERIDVDVAFGRQRYFIDDGNRCRILSITERLQPGEIRKKLLKSNVILWNAVIIRREVLTEIPLIGEGITGSYDWHFWIYAALANLSFYQIPTILGYVRISPDSVQREMIRMSTGDIECVKHYGSKLTFREKMLYGYFNAYGGRLIRYGIICMESGLVGKGRKSVIKGLLYFFVSARGRLKWLTACLILFASLVSDEKKARNRCEKLLGFDIFRNYYEKFS